jgi:hypothetical protein
LHGTAANRVAATPVAVRVEVNILGILLSPVDLGL